MSTNHDYSDHAKYLIITKINHVLSTPLNWEGKNSFSILKPSLVTTRDIESNDIILVRDADMTLDEMLHTQGLLSRVKDKLAVAVTEQDMDFWGLYTDSVLAEPDRVRQSQFINALIESVELTGLVCIDYMDVRSQFHNTGHCAYYRGSASGDNRAIQAIDDAIANHELWGDTATLILSGGLNSSVEEWQNAMAHLETHLPDTCTSIGSLKLLPNDLHTNTISASIFVNGGANQ